MPVRSFAILCVLAACPSVLWAAAKELSNTEKVALIKNPRNDAEERTRAINELADLTDPQTVRDCHAGEAMQDIAAGKLDDLFVRIAAIKGLGKYQHNAVISTKAKYIAPFTAMLKDPDQHALLRIAVASVFKDTLDAGLPMDKDGYKAELEIARNIHEAIGLRASCIQASGTFPSPDALDILAGLLNEKESLIREAAAGAIYDLIDALPETDLSLPTVNKLVEMINDKALPSDLKVNVMKVLAKLIRNDSVPAKSAFPVILQIVARSQDIKLVKGGIQSLGIIGSAEAVKPLIAAYNDFVEKEKPKPGADPATDPAPAPAEKKDEGLSNKAEIRKEVMKAMRSILAVQAGRKAGPDANAVKDVVATLVKVVDDDPSSEVKVSAIYAMQYLYPKKLESQQKEALDALIFLLEEKATKKDDSMRKAIVDALEAISGGKGFGEDEQRWKDYFQKRFGGARAAAPAPAPAGGVAGAGAPPHNP